MNGRTWSVAAGILAVSAERPQIFKRLMKYGKGLTREVQVIHFHSSRRDPAN
jgi:hypothetical protein